MYKMVMWEKGKTLEELELEVIEACYVMNRKNKTATAKELGISKRTLDAKVKKLDKKIKKATEMPRGIGDDFESQHLNRNA